MVISGMGSVQYNLGTDRNNMEPTGTISHLIKKAGELPAPPPVKLKPVEKPVEKKVETAKPVDKVVEKQAAPIERVEKPVERSLEKVQTDRQIATTRAVAAAYTAAPVPTAVVDAFA